MGSVSGNIVSMSWRLGTNLRIAQRFAEADTFEALKGRTHAVAGVLKQYGHEPEELGMQLEDDVYVPPLHDDRRMQTFQADVVSALSRHFVERGRMFAENMSENAYDAAGFVNPVVDFKAHVRVDLLTQGVANHIFQSIGMYWSRRHRAAGDFPLPKMLEAMVEFSLACKEDEGHGTVSDELLDKMGRIFDVLGVPKTALRDLRKDPLAMRDAALTDLRIPMETMLLLAEPRHLTGLSDSILYQLLSENIIEGETHHRITTSLHRGKVIDDRGQRIWESSRTLKAIRTVSTGATLLGGATLVLGVASAPELGLIGSGGTTLAALVLSIISHLALRKKK